MSRRRLRNIDRRAFVAGASAVAAVVALRPISAFALLQGVPEFVDEAKQDHMPTRVYSRRPIGRTAVPLLSYFALVADQSAVQAVNQAQSWYMRRAMQETPWQDVPILSAAAPFKAGGRGGAASYVDVPVGEVSLKEVVDLYPYDNTIQAVLITGAEVKEWLEMSAGIFNRIRPGVAEQPLRNDAFPSYNFDVIDGVSYKIDLSQPPKYDPNGVAINPLAGRIVELAYDGMPVDPAQQFVVATNDYRVVGGGFPGLSYDVSIFVGENTNREAIAAYIEAEGTIDPLPDSNWSFAALAGTSIIFQSAPKARDHLADVSGIEYLGDGESGFAKFRIAW